MRRLLPVIVVAAGACARPEAHPPLRPHAELEAEQASMPQSRSLPPPPLRAPGDAPDVTVYGYWPYWGDPLATVPWDQLTHVAIFDVGLASDGSLTSLSHWTANAADAMALAAPYGVHVHLTVTCFDDAVMASVLGSPARRTAAVQALAAQVHAYGAHGVNVDFEGLDTTWRDAFTAFVAELAGAVDEVYLAMPAVDWSDAYDEAALAAVADGLFVMGYNYHYAGGGPGPVAPLHGGGPWSSLSLARSVDDLRAVGVPDDRIVLGLPLYGYDWPTTDTTVPGTRTANATAAFFASAGITATAAGRHYDATTDTPYAFPSTTRQLWYDDAVSVAAKVGWGVDQGLQGVGFWALTYDDADVDLWTRVDALTHGPDVPDSDLPVDTDTGAADTDPVAPLTFVGVAPGVAGRVNTFTVHGGTPGARVVIVTSRALGTAAVPGCPGVTVGLRSPLVVGNVTADGAGVVTRTLRVPAAVAGDAYAFLAVEPSTCRVSGPLVAVF